MSSERIPYPFRISPLKDDVQKKIADDFEGYPNGLVSCNHWGFKLAATLTEEQMEELYNYPLDARDVWVVTPPKCGTTWSQEMIWLLANDLDYEGAKTPLMPERWNFIEVGAIMDMDGLAKLRPPGAPRVDPMAMAFAGDPQRPSPRFVKSHLPMSMNNPRLLDVCKVVYVARNPKDACVSYYHHNRLLKAHEYNGDLELFMRHFMDAIIVETPLVEHMIEAWNLRHHPNMCFIFFEDMKRDLRSQIRKIRKVAAFLGKSYSDEQIDKLASHLHIDNFKKNPWVNMEKTFNTRMVNKDRGNFIRKGKTGDWKNHFSPEMTETFDKWMAEKMKGTDLTFVQELDKQD